MNDIGGVYPWCLIQAFYPWINVRSAESRTNAFSTPVELFIAFQVFAAGRIKDIFDRQLEIFHRQYYISTK